MDTLPTEGNGIFTLAKGIFGDANDLLKHEVSLVKAELRAEIVRMKLATEALAVSMAVMLLGLVVVPFLLADLILYLSDGKIPTWGAYSIVCIVFLSIGLILYKSAKKEFSKVSKGN